MQKKLGYLIISIASILGAKFCYDLLNPEFTSEEKKFETLWQNDLILLEKTHSLPNEWSEISEVKFHLPTEKSNKWMKQIASPILLKSNGTHKLEITITDWIEPNRIGVVIQYHLINKKSGDLINEFGRTFIIK